MLYMFSEVPTGGRHSFYTLARPPITHLLASSSFLDSIFGIERQAFRKKMTDLNTMMWEQGLPYEPWL